MNKGIIRLLGLIGLMGLMGNVRAQEAVTGEMDFDARFTQFHRAYALSPDDVEALSNLAMFYFDNSNPMRNLPLAMEYIQRAEERHVWLIENNKNSDLRRLLKSGITITTLRQQRQAIVTAAQNTVATRNDMPKEEIDRYLEVFGFDMAMVSRLQQFRIQCIYEEDLQAGTVESYYHYIKQYPGTHEAELMEERLAPLAQGLFAKVTSEKEADSLAARYPLSPSVQRASQKCKSRLAYAEAVQQNTLESYKAFLERYPSSNESQQARDRIEYFVEWIYVGCRTAMDYVRFVNTYPDFSLADKALAEARRLIAEKHDIPAARYYLEHFPLDGYRNEVFGLYYAWHSAEGNGEPIKRFFAEHPDYPYIGIVEDDLLNSRAIDHINLTGNYFEAEYERYADYVRHMTGKKIAFVPLQRMLQVLVDERKYPAALERVRKFELSFEGVEEYQELQNILSAPLTGQRAVKEFAETYSVMNPAVNEADGRLYYTRVAGDMSSICYAVKEGKQWRPAGEVLFDGPVANEGLTLFGFYDGGSRMLLGADGNIMIAEVDDSLWRVTDIPPYPVNTDYIETDAYMLPDGSGMLLASDRPGGHNLQTSGVYFHGDHALATDLYFIPYSGGSWGAAVNLGNVVNTPYSERSPLLSRNLKTLYFVTDGRGGLGFGDVYVATRTDLGDWTSWSTPKNVGKEINSGHNESGLSFSSDEKTIYMAVNADPNLGNYSCYSFPTSHNSAATVRPLTLELLGWEESLSRVRVADLEQQSVTQVLDCSDSLNSVTVNVFSDRKCAVIADAGRFFAPAIIVAPHSRERATLRGYSFNELVRMERPMPLSVVGFDTLAPVLLPLAQQQLSQLARYLQLHPSAVIEFCLDVAGMDDRECYLRSVEQGDAIRNFMNHNGIEDARIIVSPYGNVNAKKGEGMGVSVRFREK